MPTPQIHIGALFVFCKNTESYVHPIQKNNAFYLQPLKRSTATCTCTCWFSKEPVGHNKLAKTVAEMCSKAGIDGFHTNHSLRATSATRLFSAGADEQLIMERTGHRSVDGVRSYKRTSDHLNEEVSDILNRSEKRQKTHIQSDSSCPPAITPSSCPPVISPPTCPPVIALPSYPPVITQLPCPPAIPPLTYPPESTTGAAAGARGLT